MLRSRGCLAFAVVRELILGQDARDRRRSSRRVVRPIGAPRFVVREDVARQRVELLRSVSCTTHRERRAKLGWFRRGSPVRPACKASEKLVRSVSGAGHDRRAFVQAKQDSER